MNKKIAVVAWLAMTTLFSGFALAEDEKFNIRHFDVEGNSLLPQETVDRLVSPFLGDNRVYGDVQKALEALENAYHALGYHTVQVFVPEQELTGGTVKLLVIETSIGKVTVAGNTYFSSENIRASIPELKEGRAPNARKMSENIQLANDNPAKQMEVALSAADEDGKVDARVNVTEQNPQRIYVTADDTGSGATGHIRMGVAYQNANLLGGDEVLTAAYTTSPDAPGGVKVDIYSVAFRKPFYGLGDSLDIIFGDSNVNTPTAQATGFGLTGKGRVLAVRWNHFFPREGEYSAKLVFGFDWKQFNTTCKTTPATSDAPPTPSAPFSCIPHTTRPVSATYSGQWQGADYSGNFNTGLSYNLPTGDRFTANTNVNPLSVPSLNGKTDYYSFIANRKVEDHFSVLRADGSYATLFKDWQFRAVVTGQWVKDGLVAGEQLGLAGATAVRGFSERAVSTDSGVILNLEAYTPDVAARLGVPGNLRGLLFYDRADGRNNGGTVPFVQYTDAKLASWGLGLRYGLNKDIAFRADLAEVLDHGPVLGVKNHTWRGHFSLSIGF